MTRPLEQTAVVAMPVLFTVAHAAQVLDRTPRQVYRLIRGGELPAVDDRGRIMVRGDDLAAYIDGMAPLTGTAPKRRRSRRRRPSDAYPYLRG